MDAKRPRIVQVVFQDVPVMNGHAEFDTAESAQDWRNELAGVSFSHRPLGRK